MSFWAYYSLKVAYILGCLIAFQNNQYVWDLIGINLHYCIISSRWMFSPSASCSVKSWPGSLPTPRYYPEHRYKSHQTQYWKIFLLLSVVGCVLTWYHGYDIGYNKIMFLYIKCQKNPHHGIPESNSQYSKGHGSLTVLLTTWTSSANGSCSGVTQFKYRTLVTW